jgi:uncharacterized protein DUF4252
MKGKALLLGGLMLLAASANAQDAFSFADIPIKKEPTIEVDLGPEMLRILGDAAKAEDPQAGLALEGVTNVRFRMYEEIDEDMRDVLRFVDATATRLQADGWQAVVRIRDGSDLIRVYMKPGTAGKLAGVAFMMTSGDGSDGSGEAMFINVSGAFEPAQLGHLASINGITGAVGVLGIIPGADGGREESEHD